MSMMCCGNGRENLPPGCIEPDDNEPDRRCSNCRRFCRAWSGDPNNYCEKKDEDGSEYYEKTEPDWCCDDHKFEEED